MKFFVLVSSLFLNFSSREILFFSIPSILLYKYHRHYREINIFFLYFVWKFWLYWFWYFFHNFLKIFLVVNSAKHYCLKVPPLSRAILPKALQIKRNCPIKFPRILVKCVLLCHFLISRLTSGPGRGLTVSIISLPPNLPLNFADF